MSDHRLAVAPCANGKPSAKAHAAAPPSANGKIGRQAEAPPTPPAPTAERDCNGRFAPGNSGGPGNPHARQVAALKRAFMEVVTPEELRNLTRNTLAFANAGNMQAAKLVYSYGLGKPAKAANPDDVDVDELHRFEEGSTFVARALPILHKPDPELTLDLLRLGRDRETQKSAGQALGYFGLPVKERQKVDKLPPEKRDAKLFREATKACRELGLLDNGAAELGRTDQLRVVTPPSANGKKR